MTQEEPDRTHWHQLLGAVLHELLAPLGVKVITDFELAPRPPRGDILLLQPDGNVWTPEQRKWLPDGLRHTDAAHILIEYKHTESFNEAALEQALLDNILYRRSNGLRHEDLQMFLVVSRQPRKKSLALFGFEKDEQVNRPGFYRTRSRIIKQVQLISLNELSAEEHNGFVKFFASQMKQKKAAIRTIEHAVRELTSEELYWIMLTLQELWFRQGDKIMATPALTPEMAKEYGKRLTKLYLRSLSPEEVFRIFPPEEMLSQIPAEERLAGLGAEERLAGLGPEERLAGLSSEEIRAYLERLETQKAEDNGL